MNEDEILEFNYKRVRKNNTLSKLHRVFSVYNSTEPLYLDLSNVSYIQTFYKNKVASGSIITMGGVSYYV